MSDKYLKRNDPDFCLKHLIEECGEVIAAAGKTLRWGPASTNPELPVEKQERNIDWLDRELVDLEKAIHRFRESRVTEKKTSSIDTVVEILIREIENGNTNTSDLAKIATEEIERRFQPSFYKYTKGKVEMIESLLTVGAEWSLITRATGITPDEFSALKAQINRFADPHAGDDVQQTTTD